MITINNLEILDQGKYLAVDVQTVPGSKITSLLVWSMNDFKNYDLAKDFTSRLEQVNNREVLIIDAGDLNTRAIEDMIFIEVESDYESEVQNCDESDKAVLGIAYNLSKYYRCLMSQLLEMNQSNCTTCKDTSNKDLVVTINLMIDAVSKAIDAGFYMQAIDIVTNLKKLCDLTGCKNCDTIVCKSCNNFKQH